MARLTVAIFCLFILILGVSLTNAINCYTCDATSSYCGDPFNKAMFNTSSYTQTNGNSTYCGKALLFGAVLQRGVFNSSTCTSNGCTLVLSSGVCCCSTELCNGVSSIHQQNFILFSIISAVATLIYRSM